MTTLNLQVGADADDGSCANDADWYPNEIYIGSEEAGYPYDDFFRFLNATIPGGATIDSAVLTFTSANNAAADTVRVKISCNDVDNATAPGNCAQLIAKARTTAQIDWDFTTDWTTNNEYQSIDFKAAIQEVVDRPGWVSGNALLVLLDDDGSSDGAHRFPYDHSVDNAKATKLTVNYTPPVPRHPATVFQIPAIV